MGELAIQLTESHSITGVNDWGYYGWSQGCELLYHCKGMNKAVAGVRSFIIAVGAHLRRTARSWGPQSTWVFEHSGMRQAFLGQVARALHGINAEGMHSGDEFEWIYPEEGPLSLLAELFSNFEMPKDWTFENMNRHRHDLSSNAANPTSLTSDHQCG